MNIKLVSVIVPMYNAADHIAMTIESVMNQEYTTWEMLIVDDCSTDSGLGVSIVEEYSKKDTRIKLIRSLENKGASGARNIAMNNANGDYYAFLDSDDLWDSDYLKRMIQFIQVHDENDIAIFFTGYRRMDEFCSSEILSPYFYEGKIDHKRLLYFCPIFPSTAILDRTKLSSIIYFREELRNLRDDWVFWLDITAQGFKALGCKDILVSYRIHNNSLTASKRKMIAPTWKMYRKYLNINIIKSSFYMLSWGINGLKKYKL
jgi:glycosyltransferase involved in cell wall biosynthesis